MSNVIPIGCITRLKLDAQQILNAALDAGLSDVVIMGFNNDGNEYFASSDPDAGNVLYHLERSKHKLMKIIDDGI
jgi:hypothetical protein